jgi:hypothetical protein
MCIFRENGVCENDDIMAGEECDLTCNFANCPYRPDLRYMEAI